MATRKVIITCAVTGSIHTPSMSPHLPVTAEQIAQNSLDAVRAGAAIVHLHARNPQTGQPDQNPALFEPFLRQIAQQSDAIINITTGGSQSMSIAERLRPAVHFQPEMASLNMGTMNFGHYPMLGRYKDLAGWEGIIPDITGSGARDSDIKRLTLIRRFRWSPQAARRRRKCSRRYLAIMKAHRIWALSICLSARY